MGNITMAKIQEHAMQLVEELNEGDFPVNVFPDAMQEIITGTHEARLILLVAQCYSLQPQP